MSHLNINGVDKPLDHVYVNTGSVVKEAWEARDKNDHLLWGRADTFTGTSSISVRGYGLPVKSWEIDGNSQQSGTPAQSAPVYPQAFGDKTPNIIPRPTSSSSGTTNGITWEITKDGVFKFTGRASAETDIDMVLENTYIVPISVGNGGNGTIAFNNTCENQGGAPLSVIFTDVNNLSDLWQMSSIDRIATSYTAIQNRKIKKLTFRIGSNYLANNDQIAVAMSDNGVGVSPFQPFGYKLSLTSAGHTQNVYLGQVPTVRWITKVVFDGTENWFATGGGDTLTYNTSISASGAPDSTAGSICTHLEYGDRYTQGQYDIGESGAIRISAKGFASLSAFTQFLVDEYANGMPFTVWYVLATRTTGIVNEPLCKIGAYADILTSDQAGITIPTTDGSNTISVDTALAPSKFEVKVHAKPVHFGFKIDKSVSDPSNAVIYTHDAVTMTPAGMDFTNGVFDYGSWENVWFIKNARPVMLNFDGTEAYDLDPNDYTKKLDGTPSDIADSTKNMNAMIAFPTVWIKRTDDGSYNYIEISDRQLDSDFHAYAHEDANGVVKPYIYLPIYKGSLVDGKLRSISGVKPQSGTTAQQEVDAASALGTGWQIWDYSSKEMLCDLLTLIGKTLDTQGKFGQGHSTGGSSESDFLDCGTLNDKGKFFGYSTTTSQVKCFGMEALWGERWDRELGLILDAGIYKIKEHPAYNLTGDGYTAISTSVAKSPTSNNYIKTEVSTRFGSLPTVVGGTSSTYYCDYFHQSQTNIRVARRGGHCDDGAGAGLRSVNVNSTASNSYWTLGASPVYK